jgi:hypothetical protein
MAAEITENLPAPKEFYAVLTPEQQKIFDAQTPHHVMRGEKHGK